MPSSAGPIRVIHFGLGPIGAGVVRQVASRKGLKIVGAVDVDCANDLESLPTGDLPDDAGADRSEPEVDDPDGTCLGWHQMTPARMKATVDYSCSPTQSGRRSRSFLVGFGP